MINRNSWKNIFQRCSFVLSNFPQLVGTRQIVKILSWRILPENRKISFRLNEPVKKFPQPFRPNRQASNGVGPGIHSLLRLTSIAFKPGSSLLAQGVSGRLWCNCFPHNSQQEDSLYVRVVLRPFVLPFIFCLGKIFSQLWCAFNEGAGIKRPLSKFLYGWKVSCWLNSIWQSLLACAKNIYCFLGHKFQFSNPLIS